VVQCGPGPLFICKGVEESCLLRLLVLILDLGDGLKQKSSVGGSGGGLGLNGDVVGFLEGRISLVMYGLLQLFMETHHQHLGLEQVAHMITGQFADVVCLRVSLDFG